MNIQILCVGKIKEKYWLAAIGEYSKRLSRYCKLSILEVPDEKTPDRASKALEEEIRKTEGDRLLGLIKKDAYIIALAIDGNELDSVGLSEKISKIAVDGNGTIQLIIGGSLGLSEEVLRAADYKLSFSKMTFPHQLMRVILLEQLYRSYRILNHEPYHK